MPALVGICLEDPMVHGPWSMGHGPWTMVHGPWSMDMRASEVGGMRPPGPPAGKWETPVRNTLLGRGRRSRVVLMVYEQPSRGFKRKADNLLNSTGVLWLPKGFGATLQGF